MFKKFEGAGNEDWKPFKFIIIEEACKDLLL